MRHRRPHQYVLLLIMFILIATTWGLSSQSVPHVSAQDAIATDFARQVIQLTNQERAAHNLPPLQESSELDAAAMIHAQAMAKQVFFDHINPSDGSTPGDRVRAAGYNWLVVAENIAQGAATPADVVRDWINSPSHHANILNLDVKEIGVAYFYALNDKSKCGDVPCYHYWVQDFGSQQTQGISLPVTPPVPSRPLPDSVLIERQIEPSVVVPGSTAHVRITLAGQDLAECRGIPEKPVDVLLVIDTSESAGDGSSGSNWARTRDFTLQLVDQLMQPLYIDRTNPPEQSRIGIITSRTGVTGPLPIVLEALTVDYALVSTAVSSIVPKGDTNIADGVRMAADLLRMEPADRERAIVLMLHDNVPIGPAALAAVKEIKQKNVAVYLVAHSLNIHPTENQISIELADDLVGSGHSFLDPEPHVVRRLSVDLTKGDPQTVAKHFRVVDTWSPDDSVDIEDITGSGRSDKKNQVAWDIPRIAKNDRQELTYLVRVSPDVVGNLQLQSGVAYIGCNGYAQTNILGEPTSLQIGPGATPMPVQVLTGTPSPTPSPSRTPTPIGAVVIPNGPTPTLQPQPVSLIGTQPVFCTVSYWWVPGLLFPLLLALLLALVFWWWSHRNQIDWLAQWRTRAWRCRIPFLMFLASLFFLSFLIGRELLVGLCQPAEAVYFWRLADARGIYLVSQVDGKPVPFTEINREGCVGCHTVSSTGRRIMAVEGPVPGHAVVKMLDGRDVPIPNIDAMYGSWSPDGSRLAYASGADENIHILDITTGKTTPLRGASDSSVAETMPAWSPDGTTIAFVRTQSGMQWGLVVVSPSDIYTVTASGGDPAPVAGASGSGFNYYPAYSPDGRWLAFTRHTTGSSSYSDPAAEVFLVPAGGGQQIRLSANDAPNGTRLTNVSNSWPTWSRDGKLLAFNSKRNDPSFDIFVTTIDDQGNSGSAEPLTGAAEPGVFEHTPFWGEPIQPLPLGERLLAIWPWLLLPLLFLLLSRLLCRSQSTSLPPLPAFRPRPSSRAPLSFSDRWIGTPPEWDPAPALIIGLGGTGRWVLTHLKKNLLDAGMGELTQRVRLLCVDTSPTMVIDGHKVSVEFAGVQLDETELLILGENLQDVCERMVKDDTSHPELQPWFPAEEYLHIRRLSDAELDVRNGTRGRRPMGRASVFQDVCQQESSRLWQRLVAELRHVVEDDRTQIFVISSLAGGMGSAVLIDVAYLARRAAQSAGAREGVVVSAVLATDNAFVANTRAQSLRLNTMAALRELGRFQLARGCPYPMPYASRSADPVFNGFCEWGLLDDLFLFDGQRPERALTRYEPTVALFPMMADVLTMLLDRAAHPLEEGRANMRVQAANEQHQRGEAMISSLGSFVYRLPLYDIVQELKVRFAKDLVRLYLVGPDFIGQELVLLAEHNREADPDGVGALVQRFLRDEVGGATAWVADLSRGSLTPEIAESLEQATRNRDAEFFAAQLQAFDSSLVGRLLLILNGSPDVDAITARAGKIGYAFSFLHELTSLLGHAQGQSSVLQSSWHGSAAVGAKLFGELIARQMEIIRARLDEVNRGVVCLLGDANQPGTSALFNRLLEDQNRRADQRRSMTQIVVRHYFADDELVDKLYRDYFVPHLTDSLERLFWQETGTGKLQFVIRHWQDIPSTDSTADDFVSALLLWAEIAGGDIWKMRLSDFMDETETGLWRATQLQNEADRARGWSNPATTYQMGHAQSALLQRFLWVNRTVQRAEPFRQMVLRLAKSGNVTRLQATDPLSAGLLATLDVVPLSALETVKGRLEVDYRHAFGLSDETAGTLPARQLPEAVHVYAAEQHALRYEQRLHELNEPPRLFHPLFVGGVENLNRARLFSLAYALGIIQRRYHRGERKEGQRYQLAVETGPGAQNIVWLTSYDNPIDTVALVVRAMQVFVLGYPDGTSWGTREYDQVYQLARQSVEAHLAQSQDPLREFLRQVPTDLLSETRFGAQDFVSFARLVVKDELTSLSRK